MYRYNVPSMSILNTNNNVQQSQMIKQQSRNADHIEEGGWENLIALNHYLIGSE